MLKKSDPYSYTKVSTLKVADAIIGNVSFHYEISLYEDVQSYGVVSVDQPKNQKFLVNCTQRMSIFNPAGMNLSPDENKNSYHDYPAMINTMIDLEGASQLMLQDYSPKTVNTQIQTSAAGGVSTSNRNSNTMGSSNSETNTFGVSVSVGDICSETIASYKRSSTVSHKKSNTSSSELSSSRQNELLKSAAMHIKDWGAYALAHPENKTPSWTFGQEYPWNAINCRKTTGVKNPFNRNQVELVIPNAMLARLYDGHSLYPPSELSTYGVNFVTKASWLVVMDNGASDIVVLNHRFNYFTGSHILPEGASMPNVYIDDLPIIPTGDTNDSFHTALSLNIMALSPLSGAAVVGFLPNKFIVAPSLSTETSMPIKFKKISPTNDLMITDTSVYPIDCEAGAGFIASETSLVSGFAPNCISLQMTLNFKVVDSVSDYIFYMKHWKIGGNGVLLTIEINNDPSLTLTQYIDDLEAEGGENNMTTIALRNQNFTSIDYHDYLQLGLNSIHITIEPIGGAYVADCGYQLRAISMETN